LGDEMWSSTRYRLRSNRGWGLADGRLNRQPAKEMWASPVNRNESLRDDWICQRYDWIFPMFIFTAPIGDRFSIKKWKPWKRPFIPPHQDFPGKISKWQVGKGFSFISIPDQTWYDALCMSSLAELSLSARSCCCTLGFPCWWPLSWHDLLWSLRRMDLLQWQLRPTRQRTSGGRGEFPREMDRIRLPACSFMLPSNRCPRWHTLIKRPSPGISVFYSQRMFTTFDGYQRFSSQSHSSMESAGEVIRPLRLNCPSWQLLSFITIESIVWWKR
jgi:hypothetical protein